MMIHYRIATAGLPLVARHGTISHPTGCQGHSDSAQQTADIYIEEAVFQMSAVKCLLSAVAMYLAGWSDAPSNLGSA